MLYDRYEATILDSLDDFGSQSSKDLNNDIPNVYDQDQLCIFPTSY